MPATWQVKAKQHLETAYDLTGDAQMRTDLFRELFAKDYPEYAWYASRNAAYVYEKAQYYIKLKIKRNIFQSDTQFLFSSKI